MAVKILRGTLSGTLRVKCIGICTHLMGEYTQIPSLLLIQRKSENCTSKKTIPYLPAGRPDQHVAGLL